MLFQGHVFEDSPMTSEAFDTILVQSIASILYNVGICTRRLSDQLLFKAQCRLQTAERKNMNDECARSIEKIGKRPTAYSTWA